MATNPTQSPKNPKNQPKSASSGTRPRQKPGPNSLVSHEGSLLSPTTIRSGCMHSMLSKIVLLGLIAIFAIGFGLSGLGPLNSGRGGPSGGPNGVNVNAAPDPVARAAGQDIKRDELQNGLAQQMQMMQQFGQSVGAPTLLTMRAQVLDSLVSQAAQYKAAQDAGFSATDAEIDAKIDKE